MARCQSAAEDCYYPSVLALHVHPLVVIGLLNRRKTHLHVHLITLEEKVFHYISRHRAVSLDKQPQRKIVMDIGLADIQYAGIVLGEDIRQSRRHTRTVIAGDIDHY